MFPRLPAVLFTALTTVLPLSAITPGITLGQAVLSPQGTALIDISFTPPDQAVTGIQFDIRFASQAFDLSASAPNELTGLGKALWTSSPDPALLRILIVGLNQNVLSGGVIATLSVRVNAVAPAGLYPLEVDDAVGSDPNGMAVFLPTSNGSITITGPGPTIAAVANAASWTTGPIAPGEIVVIGGTGLGASTLNTLQIASTGRAATVLADTRVLFGGVPAPLVYTNQAQISAIAPYEINGHNQTSLQVEYQGIQSTPFLLPVAAASPGIFTVNTSGAGQGAIVNQDGTLNEPDQPALRGSVVSVYGTGDGQTLPVGTDGMVIGTPSDLRYTLLPVTASIGGQPADVIYAGSVGGQVAGMFQANIRIPQTVTPGASVPLTIRIGTSNTQPGVTMAIQ